METKTIITTEHRTLLAVPVKEGGHAAFWLEDVLLLRDLDSGGCAILIAGHGDEEYRVYSSLSVEAFVQMAREALA